MSRLGKRGNRREKEDLTDKDININVGSSGLLNVETKDKRLQYANLLTEITEETIHEMARVFEDSKTKTQAFMRLEDRAISLEYLIALGLTTEEQIYTYQNIRERGVLEQVTQQIGESGTSVDEDYALEIQQLSRPIPPLRDIEGHQLDEQMTLAELNTQQLDEIIVLKSEISRLQRELHEAKERLSLNQDDYKDEDDIDYENKIFTTLKREKAAQEEIDPMILTDEQREQVETAKAWQEALANLQRSAQDGPSYDRQPTDGELPFETTEEDDGIRKVYILSTEIPLPEIEGYDFKLIESSVDLSYFTASKSNLLVITSRLPRYIGELFVDWIKGVLQSSTGYRMVTLKGSEIKHPLIEDTIELTKESLDNYYDTHELEKYTGDGVGSFLDISHILE